MRAKIKSFFISVSQAIQRHPVVCYLLVLYAVLVSAICFVSFDELIGRLSYELKEIGNYDTYLYYTVGRALSEGLRPYADMYENKPPLIFLLSAISYKTLGNYYLTNVLSFLSFLTILSVPVAFSVIACVKRKTSFSLAVIIVIFTFSTSTLFTLFSEEHSAEVQIEAFGTACCLISILCSYLSDGEKVKFFSPQVILSGMFMGFAVMFKEPFAIVGGVSLLLFCHNKRDLIYKILFPIVYALVVCVIILLASNCFVPYFTIYLKNMFSSHISIYGSPFERMLNIKKLFDYSFDFSEILPVIIVFSLLIVMKREMTFDYAKNSIVNAILKMLFALKPIIFLYATSFVVGLGGQYYNHHFIFAMAFYCALLLSCVDYFAGVRVEKIDLKSFSFKPYEKDKNQMLEQNECDNEPKRPVITAKALIKSFGLYPLLIVLVLLQCFAFTKTADYSVGLDNVIKLSQKTKTDARYIDDVLDVLGEENYLWVGFNGYNPYSYTEHLPLGPSFVQDPHNFTDRDGFFSQEFMKQLETTNVIILQDLSINLGVLSEEVCTYINTKFTFLQPLKIVDSGLERPGDFNFYIFYRKETYQLP